MAVKDHHTVYYKIVMGNHLATVNDHKRLLLGFGVSRGVVERINYIAIVNDHGKNIRKEMDMKLKDRMPVRKGEHIVIVISLVFLNQYGLQFIKEFNRFMLHMGFRIYGKVLWRARYHMEYLKREAIHFYKVLEKYLLPIPVPVLVVSYSDKVELKRLPDSDEQWVPANYHDSVCLPPFSGPLELNDPLEYSEQMAHNGEIQLIDVSEESHQLWFDSTIQANNYWFSEGMCISNTLQDDEAALDLLGNPVDMK